MNEFRYGYSKKLEGIEFEQAIEKVISALKEEGFGVLSDIDVKSTLKKKLDKDFRNYRILGACNPPFAYKALEAEAHIGLLLPCNVVVQEFVSNGIEVSIADPTAMFTLVDNSDIAPIATEIENKLRKVLAAL